MLGLSSAKDMARRLMRARAAASQGLKTKLFDDWRPELDEALGVLPEAEVFPHELFRMLMQMSPRDKRKLILVTERGVPVALAGLRNRRDFWEPVTQWIVPGVLFPVKEGYVGRVLPALGLEIGVGWWRWPGPPPKIGAIRDVRSDPTYGICFSDDFEKAWRQQGHLKNVGQARKRCTGFEPRVNAADSLKWTIKNWDAKWRAPSSATIQDVSERLAVAEYLQKRGLHYSLSLHEGDKIVAGLTLLLHRGEVVTHHSYRDPEYDKLGVMTRLLDFGVYWARDMGFAGIDMGGTYDYKKRWAPEAGEKWVFTVSPDFIQYKERLSLILGKVRNRLKPNLKRNSSV